MARVLLVEDEPVVRRITARVLRSKGHVVVEAADVAEARAVAGEFDVAILDKNLPDGSGIDLAGELVRAEPALPVIILSGYASDAAVRAALDAGVHEFLRKPLANVHELTDAIDQALAARAEGRTLRPRGAPEGPLVVCDRGVRGDALVAAAARAGRRVARVEDGGGVRAALAAEGAAALVVAGERRELVLEALAAARSATPPVPALVVAARGALEEILLALRAGATAYLVDVTPEEVLGRVVSR